MEIIKPEDFTQIIKNKYILLDTNIFIDASYKPTVFGEFFEELKNNNTVITTLVFVIVEFLRGIGEEQKYRERQKMIDQIIDIYLPIQQETQDNVFELIKRYGYDGKNPSIIDLLLGATLMLYGPDLFLLTKDTTDFPSTIFDLVSVCNFSPKNKKGIQTYGLYRYK